MTTSATADDEVEQYRISKLPDEIIHDIHARLKSPKEAATTIFLSKTWARLWLSYPFLEFSVYQFRSSESQQSFATAVMNKFLKSDGAPPAEAARVTTDWYDMGPEPCSAFLDGVFECIAKASPREIDIQTLSFDEFAEELHLIDTTAYTIPQGFLLPNDFNKFRRLKVLKLADCNFRQDANIMSIDQNNSNPFAGLGSSLKELHLQHVSFPDERILNSIISAASLLETLTLVTIIGIHKFQVANHLNLKVLRADMVDSKDFIIKEAHSLEIMRFSSRVKCELKVSSTPNLKVLHIEHALALTDEILNKLLNESPYLESLILVDVPRVQDLKIVNKDQLREVELHLQDYMNWPSVIEIDAPSLTNFFYSGNVSIFPAFFNKTRICYGADSQPIKLPLCCLKMRGRVDFGKLKQLLAGLSQFRVTVKFDRDIYQAPSDQVTDMELLTPIVERVKVFSDKLRRNTTDDIGLLDSLLWSCHPKYLSFKIRSVHQELKHQLNLLLLCKEFMERDSNENCPFK